MTSKQKNTIAWIVGCMCAGILVIGRLIASHGQSHPAVAFKEGGQLGLMGTAVGYALARLVLAFIPSNSEQSKDDLARDCSETNETSVVNRNAGPSPNSSEHGFT